MERRQKQLRSPAVVRSWRNNWSKVIPMFSFVPEIRRAIYTTNTIESLNMTLRKVIKNRAMFPSDEAVFKILYLALKNISKKWTMPIRDWSSAMNQFAILFENRLPNNGFNQNSFTHL
jgi:putative transposase